MIRQSPDPHSVKRVIAFRFRCVWVWEIICKAIDLINYTNSITLRYFFEIFRCEIFNFNPVAQSSSSFFNSSHGIGSPGSFLAFQASSISIRSSNSCNSLNSFIETIAAKGSPRRVRTNDSFPKATRFRIIESFFSGVCCSYFAKHGLLQFVYIVHFVHIGPHDYNLSIESI
jgi:hypothetical protein